MREDWNDRSIARWGSCKDLYNSSTSWSEGENSNITIVTCQALTLHEALCRALDITISVLILGHRSARQVCFPHFSNEETEPQKG